MQGSERVIVTLSVRRPQLYASGTELTTERRSAYGE